MLFGCFRSKNSSLYLLFICFSTVGCFSETQIKPLCVALEAAHIEFSSDFFLVAVWIIELVIVWERITQSALLHMQNLKLRIC